MTHRAPRQRAQRAEIAQCAARAMVDGSARDFDDARQRALRMSGADDKRMAPDNLEIHRAMVAYLELFHRDAQAALLMRLRTVALKALHFFAAFEPRLCGPVWYGTACEDTPISVHLFSDEAEAVTRFLHDRHIDYNLGESLMRFPGGARSKRIPVFHVTLGGEAFELAVFATGGEARHPLSSLDERPIRRINARELEALIESGQLFPDPRSRAG